MISFIELFVASCSSCLVPIAQCIMKAVVICTSLVLLASNAFARHGPPHDFLESEERRANLQECGKAQGLEDLKEIKHALFHGDSGETVVNSGCLKACMFEKEGVFDSAGNINADKLFENISEHMPADNPRKETLKQKIETCAESTATISDKCEKATNFAKCAFPRHHGPHHPPGPPPDFDEE